MSKYKCVLRVLFCLLLSLVSRLLFTPQPSSASHANVFLRSQQTLRIALDKNTIDYFLYKAAPTGFQFELVSKFASSLNLAVDVLPVNSQQEGMHAVKNGVVDFYATSQPLENAPTELLPIPCNANKCADVFPLTPQITWIFSLENSDLLALANHWLVEGGLSARINYALQSKYGKRGYMRQFHENPSNPEPHILSTYDPLIKKAAANTRWDWRWIAAIIYQESRFNPALRSRRGAYGLMQMTPATARHFGIQQLQTPEEQIEAGINYLMWLDSEFVKSGVPLNMRDDFILAAYNAGYSRIKKAQGIAHKFGLSSFVWTGNVAHTLVIMSTPSRRSTPLASLYGAGETCNFVRQINERYSHYKNLL